MRIGVFTDSYLPYTSGVVTSITTFNEELRRLGHEVFVFAPKYHGYRDTDEGVFRFFSVPAPTNPDYALAVPVSPRLALTVGKLELDLVHAHSPFNLGWWGARCARRFDLPLVFTYHTLYDQYVHYVPLAGPLARDLAVRYSRRFCDRCDLVITPTRQVEALVSGYGVRAPVRVIPTGVRLERFQQRRAGWLRSTWGIPSDAKVCLFVGRLTREKNLDFLLRAFAMVKAIISEAVLVIVAGGPLEQELKQLAVDLGLGLDRDVVFTGRLGYDDVVDAYFDADLFTFASVTETQGLVLVEAMAAGLPVVAVRAFGVSDMVEDGKSGVLVEPDLEQFALQVVGLLRDDSRRAAMAPVARARAESLSSRATAARLEHEYREVLARHRNRRGEPSARRRQDFMFLA